MMDYPGVVLRSPALAHMSASTLLQHHSSGVVGGGSMSTTSGGGMGIIQGGGGSQSSSTPLQYGSWETRESSPLSDDGQTMKDSLER